MIDPAAASDLIVGLILILAAASVAGVSFAVRWFVKAGKCAVLAQRAMEQLQRDNDRDRATHDDLFRAVRQMRKDVADLRTEVAKLDVRLDALGKD